MVKKKLEQCFYCKKAIRTVYRTHVIDNMGTIIPYHYQCYINDIVGFCKAMRKKRGNKCPKLDEGS